MCNIRNDQQLVGPGWSSALLSATKPLSNDLVHRIDSTRVAVALRTPRFTQSLISGTRFGRSVIQSPPPVAIVKQLFPTR